MTMKKTVSLILVLTILALSLISCIKSPDKSEENIKVPENSRFLIGEWERYSDGDTMYFCLRKDESFSFNCACGNAVGNADLYDTFEYLEEQSMIRAYDSQDKESYQDYRLYMHGKNFIVIDVDGEMMEFWLENTNRSDIPSNASARCGELMDGYTMHRCMTDISDSEIVLVPPYYDGDVKEHKKEKITLKLASEVEFLSVDVKTTNKDGEETSEIKEETWTLQDMKYLLDTNLGEGFVWLNDDLEVYKILIYGELYIWE